MSFTWTEPGEWWLPLHPGAPASGILSCDSRTGLKLNDVAGGWLANLGAAVPTAPEIIIGQSNSAALYTCVGNYYINVKHAAAAGGALVVTANIDVQTVIKKQHFNAPDAVTF
jgi:hypothetical protein